MSLRRYGGAVLCMLVFCAGSGQAKVVDRTLAIVNGEAIMLSEYEKAVTPVMEQYKMVTPPAEQSSEKTKELKLKLLDQMIDDKILKQEAKKRKIRISKRDIDEGIAQVKTRFATEAEFQKELQNEGITAVEFENRIKEQLMVMKLTEQEVKTGTERPSESEIQKFFSQIEEKMKGKNLGLKPEEEDEFDRLAKYFTRATSEQVRARHILVQLEKNASLKDKTAALKRIKEAKAKIDKGEDFSDVAKAYSEDPGSAARGGDLGYFAKGDMLPEFERAAFSLAVGGVSEPVLSDFGYHVIKVEEKKAATKISYANVKNDLEQYLFQKGAQKKYEKWLKELRASATIKINEIE